MAVNSPLVGVNEENVVKEVETRSVSKMSNWWTRHWRIFLAELVATALLIFFGCMTCIPIDGLSANTSLYTPLGFGMVIVCIIQSFGHISGAFMNPTIAIAAVIWGKFSISVGIGYTVAECIGAIIGYGMLMAMSTIDVYATGLCVNLPHVSHSVFQTLGVEVAFAAALGFLTCSMWDPVYEEKNETNPIKFGISVAGLAIAGGSLGGASMNPARSLGPALWTNRWSLHWVYWIGPLFGAAVSAAFYKFIWQRVPKIKETLNKREILAWPDSGEA